MFYNFVNIFGSTAELNKLDILSRERQLAETCRWLLEIHSSDSLLELDRSSWFIESYSLRVVCVE